MVNPSRSFLDSVKGKLSRRSSNASTKSATSVSGTTFSQTPVQAPPAAVDEAPPPSYTEATTGPAITINGPPAITRAVSPSPSTASRLSAASMSTPEDPYAFLSTFDTIFLIDDSGSMAGRSWREVKQALRAITPICTAHDSDGIDIYFLHARNQQNQSGGWCNVRDAAQVEDIFMTVNPGGNTPTGTRINQILKPYLQGFERGVVAAGGDAEESGVKPINVIVITDGAATDELEGVLINIAKKLDRLEAPPYQVGIQFFQVGNERGATEALNALDDELGSGIRDMIDTVTWNSRDGRAQTLTANSILKVVLGAVIRRLDRIPATGRNSRLAP
ncbi:hypothetical protein B0H67DRAFT_593850 [Lasiosphaeris hirsuta]|uniref:VWFA domain-containing protein n=1 Tax=Lasiosphaeris hirsuta TaxID=260670 RepID=A0AA39ZX94_9PEZI|nr:hypothetical protein B0H67DRAFT_593850 [Lasiosphaeris hirsuta]